MHAHLVQYCDFAIPLSSRMSCHFSSSKYQKGLENKDKEYQGSVSSEFFYIKFTLVPEILIKKN